MVHINLGMDRKTFFEKYYDKNWFLQRQAFKPGAFSWSDLDDALYGWEPQERQINLFKNGPVPAEQFTETYVDANDQRTRIVKDVLYKFLKDGATLVLNKLQLHSPVIHDYCMNLAQFIGEKTNANAYAAFGGDGSFGKHWDTHGVFVLQLIGRKHWRVYAPTFEQPLAHQKSTHHKADCPKEPVLDTILEAGDLLYIPRGWWHDALPMEGQPTFHIAVGTFPIKVIDYLFWLCSNKLTEHIGGRQSLNAYSDIQTPIANVTEKLSELLSDPIMLQEFQQAVHEQQRVRSRFNIAELAEHYAENSSENMKNPIARLNTFTPISNQQESVMINGFKLNLDASSREFLVTLGQRNFPENNEEEKVYSLKQRQLLKQLSEYDVVELIN